MKNVIATTTSCLLVFASMGFAQNVSAQEHGVERDRNHREPATLTVTGNGEVAEPPDRASVRLGVEVQADDAAAAQSSVNATMQKALEKIKKTGIPERAIRTAGLSLHPVYAPRKSGKETEQPRVVAYRASNTIEVQVDDLELVGEVIDAGVAAGANRLEGISFELKNDLAQKTRALTEAVDEARTKAKALAEALDVRLISVKQVTEGGVTVFPRRESFAGARMALSAATPVQPGEVRVNASVTIRYEI